MCCHLFTFLYILFICFTDCIILKFLKEMWRFALSNLLFKKVLLFCYCHMTGSMLPGGKETGLDTNSAFPFYLFNI